MAEKFPSLDSGKHRTVGLDMARFGDHGARAAVVVAERQRLSLHWSRADGTWGVFTREHAPLDVAPRRTDSTFGLGWSGRVGLAAADDQVVLVYKRRFPLGFGLVATDARELYIDPFVADATSGDLRGRNRPLRVPREGLNINSFGFWVWADLVDGRLLVVAQVVPDNVDRTPTLALLDTSWPKADPGLLESTAEWNVTELDPGGWDFDARREGPRLAVLHRREAATHVLDLPLVELPIVGRMFVGPATVALGDAPDAPVRLSQLRQASLTLVNVDVPTRTVTSIETDLGFGENPRVHSVDPFIATVDRLESGTIVVRPREVQLQRLQSEAHLLMRTRLGWRTARLLNQPLRWAATRARFARVHQALALEPGPGLAARRLSWAPLWSERPLVLFRRQETNKGTLLTFGHQHPELGALRATAFLVFEDDGGENLRAVPKEFAILDLGHRQVRRAQGDERERVEHRQLQPHRVDVSAFHGDVPNRGLRVRREEDAGNTLAGLLTAVTARPDSGYAYTEMGDGGVRVVFESGLELPAPTATVEEKVFAPQWVAEPLLPGRAWVRLTSGSVGDTNLPGAFAPPLPFVDTNLPGVFAPPTLLNAVSLACVLQQALDGLSLAANAIRALTPASPADPLVFAVPPNGDGRVRYSSASNVLSGGLVTFVSVTPGASAALQAFVSDASGLAPPPPAVSEPDQPFVVEIRRTRSQAFAGDDIDFDAVVPSDPAADGYVFDWTFPDDTTATGPHVTHVFTATRPDFSRPAPGSVTDDHVIRLTATAPDGRVSRVRMSLALERSLWAVLWTAYSAFRRASDDVLDDGGDWSIGAREWQSYLTPGMFVRDVTVSFYRYSLRYRVDADGRGVRVEVSIRDTHDGRFRFLGNPSGQGDVEYEVPVRAALTDVVLTGAFGGGLGALVRINRVDVILRCRQRFTLGVQASERRDGSDEILERNEILRPRTMIPSGLAALPVDPTTHTVDDLVVDGGLTGAGWTLGVLVPALIAVVGVAAVFAILWPLFVVAAPAIAAAGGVIALSLIVSALVGAGVGATATLLLDQGVIQPRLRSTIREALRAPEVAADLRAAGLLTYAGEGLSEAIAIALIEQAREDGHDIDAPANDGFDRLRSPFIETIVVSEGECKALIRV